MHATPHMKVSQTLRPIFAWQILSMPGRLNLLKYRMIDAEFRRFRLPDELSMRDPYQLNEDIFRRAEVTINAVFEIFEGIDQPAQSFPFPQRPSLRSNRVPIED